LLWLSKGIRASAGGSIIQLLCFAQEEEGQPGAGRTRMRTRKRALTAKTDQQRGALPETLKTWLCTPIPAGSPIKTVHVVLGAEMAGVVGTLKLPQVLIRH